MFFYVFPVLLVASAFADEYHKIVINETEEKVHVSKFQTVCAITGATTEGIIWRRTSNGHSQIKGCRSSSGQKLEFDQEFTDHQARWKCVKDGDTVKLIPIACVLNGRVILLDETVPRGSFFVQCTRNERGLKLKIVGCKDEEKNMARLGDLFKLGDFLFLCEDNEKGASTVGIGCFVQERFLDLGEMAQIGDYVYQCQARGRHSLKLEVVGCASETGDLLVAGETFRRGMVLYRCQETADKRTFETVAIGCVVCDLSKNCKPVREYLFGERWYESYKTNYGYTAECQQRNGRVGPRYVECIFHTNSGRKVLPVGCGLQLDSKHIATCIDTDKGVMARKKKIDKGRTVSQMLGSIPHC